MINPMVSTLIRSYIVERELFLFYGCCVWMVLGALYKGTSTFGQAPQKIDHVRKRQYLWLGMVHRWRIELDLEFLGCLQRYIQIGTVPSPLNSPAS